MSELPLAVRIAAGLAATAVERARRLPQDLAELPVTAVSQAMQMSMRVQQQITDLAIKGDNAIAQLRSPAEEPPWAVFDEDLDDNVYQPGYQPGYQPRAGRAEPPDSDDGVVQAELAREWYEAEYDEEYDEVEVPEIIVEPLDADAELPDTSAEPPDAGAETADTRGSDGGHTVSRARTRAAATADTPGGPGVLPNYAELSLASVRARLRKFGLDDLQALLDYERGHAGRPEFVRMLTNRINTVRGR